MLFVVSPTKLDRDSFMQRAPLARCLPRLTVGGNVNGSIAFGNQRGVRPFTTMPSLEGRRTTTR